jgi:hypothetical protein
VARRKGVFYLSLALLLALASAVGFIFWIALSLGYPPPDPDIRNRGRVLAFLGLGAFLLGAVGAVSYAVASLRAFLRRD